MMVLACLLMSIGLFFLAVSVIGMWRFPDVFCRMHAVGKASTLGLLFVLVGSAMIFAQTSVTIKAGLAILFQFLTIPVATHLLARIAYLGGVPKESIVADVDEISEKLRPAHIEKTNPE